MWSYFRRREEQSSIWIAELNISDRTARKLWGKHGIDQYDIRDAVMCVAGLTFAWDDDPERGLRAIVETTINGRRVLVVLYPVDDPIGDRWNLGSAYFV